MKKRAAPLFLAVLTACALACRRWPPRRPLPKPPPPYFTQ